MTDVCFDLSHGSFASACRDQQKLADAATKPAVLPPKGACQPEEVFVPRGTSAIELTALLEAKPV
ncbi:MAG: hypothetical protein A3J37_06760 [Alphaproteobacteria bacterium RIFCSPHIGHO2_12_FULL_45_9]|nr:MAG: hypothetical protein A3B66_10475 [Alphaproteobacteria bacterium RIFCSPHIGHO2_02_FULL_46_13]OFW97196.1 MAG: hypothetical protein A3J37_06760 [Alphaproteobacteria bacterium RIFCSPHIGHO2_12_FULL_45_9]